MRTVIMPNDVLLPEVVAMVNTGRSVTLRTKGVSMLPFIVGGRDSVILQRATAPLALYDIVLAEVTPGHYVLHRIVGIRGEAITLMGDGNLLQQEHCTPAQIRAKAVKIVRDGKHIDCHTPAEQRKARLWHALTPLRRYLLAIYRRIPARAK